MNPLHPPRPGMGVYVRSRPNVADVTPVTGDVKAGFTKIYKKFGWDFAAYWLSSVS
jgi:hypothetical protein